MRWSSTSLKLFNVAALSRCFAGVEPISRIKNTAPDYALEVTAEQGTIKGRTAVGNQKRNIGYFLHRYNEMSLDPSQYEND